MKKDQYKRQSQQNKGDTRVPADKDDVESRWWLGIASYFVYIYL
jgi:hypothetical protein